MNYRKTTSRLRGLTKPNAPLVLIAACILAVLLVLRAATPDAAHAQQNEGDQSHAGAQNPATPLATPLPYFSVTWTATANGDINTVDGNGVGTVATRRIVMAGSGIVRKLDNNPNGAQDASPFNVTITDDYDKVTTYAVMEAGCPQGGLHRDHESWSITDPTRDNPGPDAWLKISTPVHRPDNTWYIQDPFPLFYVFRNRRYKWIQESFNCVGQTTLFNDLSNDLNDFASVTYPASPDPIEGDRDGNVFTANKHSTGRAGDLDLTVNWTFLARRLIDRDLNVQRLEVTQGLQDVANSIPLVQGRRTVVRAYIGLGREQTPVDNVTGRLRVFSGATELGAVNPFNPGGRITARVLPNWLTINDTLNFEVPLPWTEMPSLRFEVEVNPDASILETDFTNNKLSASLNPKDCNAGIDIGYLPIHFTPPEGNFGFPQDPNPKIAVAPEFMRKIFPIPERGLKYSLLPGATWRISLNYSDPGDLLLNALEQRRMNSSPRPGHIFGWLPRGGFTFASGYALRPGGSAWGTDGDRWQIALPHEIGHNKGLIHTEEGTGGSHWFDVYERTIKPPFENQQLLGIMVNPVPRGAEFWISPTQYRFLMGKMCTGAAQIPEELRQSPTVTDNLIVTGIIDNLTIAAGKLDPLYRTTTAATEIPFAGTAYCVKLKNAAGSVLRQYCFDVSFEGEDGISAAGAPFGMSVPYPAGLNRVELVKGTSVLSSYSASANPPAVTLTFPNASGLTLSGVQNVTWNGNDPDGGTLTYSLLYSRDSGATWVGIGSNIIGTSYALDFSSLPGGTSSLIKAMVSDGFRSAEDIADNPFSVANKPPIAAIVSPPTDTSFPANTKLTLQATGADLEDGSLGDAAFNWSSDRDGLLGSGQVLETNLSIGTHTITLTTRDSSGLTNTATITCTAASTASSSAVSGRVLTPDSRGLRNATVSITDSNGVVRTATTSSFGFYSFDNVATGQQYTVRVQSRLYRFAARTLTINDNVVNLDFVGLE